MTCYLLAFKLIDLDRLFSQIAKEQHILPGILLDRTLVLIWGLGRSCRLHADPAKPSTLGFGGSAFASGNVAQSPVPPSTPANPQTSIRPQSTSASAPNSVEKPAPTPTTGNISSHCILKCESPLCCVSCYLLVSLQTLFTPASVGVNGLQQIDNTKSARSPNQISCCCICRRQWILEHISDGRALLCILQSILDSAWVLSTIKGCPSSSLPDNIHSIWCLELVWWNTAHSSHVSQQIFGYGNAANLNIDLVADFGFEASSFGTFPTQSTEQAATSKQAPSNSAQAPVAENDWDLFFNERWYLHACLTIQVSLCLPFPSLAMNSIVAAGPG